MTPSDTAEQLRLACLRLDACYETAIAKNDPSAAVAAQRELNKLRGLYAIPDVDDGPDAAELAAELDAVQRHLGPVMTQWSNIGTNPTSELARLASSEILRLRGNAR